MTSVRQPAVANQFYPGDAPTLQEEVNRYLDEGFSTAPVPKAIIAPHAGYIYSGSVAASAYRLLRSARGRIRRVVLLGPAHRVYLRGIALSSADRFNTPIGFIDVSREAYTRLADLPHVGVADKAHAYEHSLEVHLPFLQSVLDDFKLVPMVVGDVAPAQVAEVLARLWGGEETLIVISSDLSHYHDYGTAWQLDGETTKSIESLRYEQIGPANACGCMPLNGLLYLARERGLRVQTLDVRNSGDTAGPRDRVVGYGAYALYEERGREYSEDERKLLLKTARESIAHGLHAGQPVRVDLVSVPPSLRQPRASFVTLERSGQLRGCIGTLEAYRPLATDVAANAYASAFRDPRFPAVSAQELSTLDVHISVLAPAAAITFADEDDLIARLRPGVDGLIIQLGDRRATFLPSVWEALPQPLKFLQALKQKARIAPSEDVRHLQAWRYTTESFVDASVS